MMENSSSSTSAEIMSTRDDDDLEPSSKKIKTDTFPKPDLFADNRDKLESRLIGVLSCVVCFDLPNGAIYQCQYGHLMCIGCFNHLLADGRLKNEQASCPSCRTEISSKNASRNLAVEKAVSELPSQCEYCKEELPRSQIPHHENDVCEQRPSTCRYKSLGCKWDGMKHQVDDHETECLHPQKTGSELMEGISLLASDAKDEVDKLKGLLKMLSYERIQWCDVQLCPNRTDDYIPKLYYETNRFNAFDQLWVMRAKIIGNETNANRGLSYQISLKGKGTFEVKYFVIKGPYGDAKITPDVQRFEFRDDNKDSEYHTLLLEGDGECNRLLAARTINVRLMMFLVKK